MATTDMPTYQELLANEQLPVVAINQNSFFTFVSAAFEKEYGWRAEELLGKPITTIIPSYLRDAHQIGFARFLQIETSTFLGKHIPLAMLYKDGTVHEADHYIVGRKENGSWQFAASITPLT